MKNVPSFEWKSTVSAGGPTITDWDFPNAEQEAPFEAKALFSRFCQEFEETLSLCQDKRFNVTGLVSRIGPDIHGKPSIELSDRLGGQCYVLFVFASEEDYKQVSEGDTVVCRGNYLGVTNEFGVVMKRSEVV